MKGVERCLGSKKDAHGWKDLLVPAPDMRDVCARLADVDVRGCDRPSGCNLSMGNDGLCVWSN